MTRNTIAKKAGTDVLNNMRSVVARLGIYTGQTEIKDEDVAEIYASLVEAEKLFAGIKASFGVVVVERKKTLYQLAFQYLRDGLWTSAMQLVNALVRFTHKSAVTKELVEMMSGSDTAPEPVAATVPSTETIFEQAEIEGSGSSPTVVASAKPEYTAEMIFALSEESVAEDAPIQIVFTPLGQTMIISDFPDTQLGRQVRGLRDFILNKTYGSAESRLQPSSIMNQLLIQATDPDTKRLAGYVQVFKAALSSLQHATFVFEEAPSIAATA